MLENLGDQFSDFYSNLCPIQNFKQLQEEIKGKNNLQIHLHKHLIPYNKESQDLKTAEFSVITSLIKSAYNFIRRFYRASTRLIVTWFTEELVSIAGELGSFWLLVSKKVGCVGDGRVVWVLNMKIISDIVGLFAAQSCTHNRPTWMHRSTSELGHDCLIGKSIISKAFPSFHRFHVCIIHNALD